MSTAVHSSSDPSHGIHATTTLLVAAIAMIGLGMLSLSMPFLSAVIFEAMVAWLFVFAGIARLVYSFEGRKKGGFFFGMLFGLFTIAVGAGMLMYPGQGVLALTWLLAWYFIVGGVLHFLWSMSIRPVKGWGWLLTVSLLNILCGALILSAWPSSALWVIGTFIGVDLIVSGFSVLSFREHLKHLAA